LERWLQREAQGVKMKDAEIIRELRELREFPQIFNAKAQRQEDAKYFLPRIHTDGHG
jgi:hypothetical protein